MNKILILANNSGGLYDFRRELLTALGKNHEIVVSTPFDEKVTELRKCVTRLVETRIERRGMNPIRDLSLLRVYFALVKKERPDMVITYTIKPNIYGGVVCRLLRVPYAANITGLGTAFERRGLLRKMVTMMYRFSLKKAKVVFFENAENKQMFIDERMIHRKQAKLLNGAGVNLERFSVLPYPQDSEETRFLFIGRVMAEKGVDELFAAMRRLRADGVKCSLDMLGDFDEDYTAIIKVAEDEGWLRYHGYQNDVRPFIEKCHCFVLPSWHEGMANTNLECASSGRPIITSNIPGCREAVTDGSGLLCLPKNAESLYLAMKAMTEKSIQEREKMGRVGRKHMEDVFDKKKVVEETMRYLG